MIIRVAKNKENPYVMIDKYSVNDPNLSLKAKGLLVYLISKPDNWHVRVADLINHCKDGETAVRSALEELEAAGYIVRQEQARDNGNGQFAPVERTVYERPHGENPHADGPDAEKLPYNNNDLPSNEDQSLPTTSGRARPGDLPYSFEGWLNLIKDSTNKQAAIARMVHTLFPDRFPDGIPKEYYARVAKTAKHKRIGNFGRLAQLVWQSSGLRPTGDVLSYCIGLAKGTAQTAERTAQHPGDQVTEQDGKRVVKVGR